MEPASTHSPSWAAADPTLRPWCSSQLDTEPICQSWREPRGNALWSFLSTSVGTVTSSFPTSIMHPHLAIVKGVLSLLQYVVQNIAFSNPQSCTVEHNSSPRLSQAHFISLSTICIYVSQFACVLVHANVEYMLTDQSDCDGSKQADKRQCSGRMEQSTRYSLHRSNPRWIMSSQR